MPGKPGNLSVQARPGQAYTAGPGLYGLLRPLSVCLAAGCPAAGCPITSYPAASCPAADCLAISCLSVCPSVCRCLSVLLLPLLSILWLSFRCQLCRVSSYVYKYVLFP